MGPSLSQLGLGQVLKSWHIKFSSPLSVRLQEQIKDSLQGIGTEDQANKVHQQSSHERKQRYNGCYKLVVMNIYALA